MYRSSSASIPYTPDESIDSSSILSLKYGGSLFYRDLALWSIIMYITSVETTIGPHFIQIILFK